MSCKEPKDPRATSEENAGCLFLMAAIVLLFAANTAVTVVTHLIDAGWRP